MPPRSMVSMTTLEVELRTPVKPSTLTPGMVCRQRLKTGAPSITRIRSGSRGRREGLVAQRGVGVRDGPFVGGDDVHAAGEGGADVGDGGFAGGGIQRGEFDGAIGGSGVQEGFDGCRARAEVRGFERSPGRPAGSAAVPWRSVWMPVMRKGKSRRFARSRRPSARPTLP